MFLIDYLTLFYNKKWGLLLIIGSMCIGLESHALGTDYKIKLWERVLS